MSRYITKKTIGKIILLASVLFSLYGLVWVYLYRVKGFHIFTGIILILMLITIGHGLLDGSNSEDDDKNE